MIGCNIEYKQTKNQITKTYGKKLYIVQQFINT